jgi:hypothetical protein
MGLFISVYLSRLSSHCYNSGLVARCDQCHWFIVETVTLDHAVETMTLDTIVAFYALDYPIDVIGRDVP